jgi:hypothetical protein
MNAKETGRTERRGIGIATETFESLGFAFREQSESDYGIDAHAELIQSEQATGQILGIQLKSGQSYLSKKNENGFIFQTDEKHVNYWCNHALPVLICLCDVETRNIYWQVVNQETAISTGKGYKIIVPATQLIDSASIETLQKMLTPIVPTKRFTILKTDDSSHGAAKRYSFAVLINGTATKSEIASIVRQITKNGIKSRYYRSNITENRYADSDAQVVWTFIYPTAEDYQRGALWICRSIWIDNNLDEQFRPMGFDGENIGDDIVVDWNNNYDEWSKLLSERTASKEEYLSTILPIISKLEVIFAKILEMISKYSNNEIDEEEFILVTRDDLKQVYELYRESIDLPFSAPFECRDIEDNFQSFVALFDNIRLLYDESSRDNRSRENRLYLSISQCKDAFEKLNNFKHELSKIR